MTTRKYRQVPQSTDMAEEVGDGCFESTQVKNFEYGWGLPGGSDMQTGTRRLGKEMGKR